MNRIGSIALPALLALLAAGCSSPAATGNSAATVGIKVFQFGPGVLEVTRGTRVEWKNQDAILHTATSGQAIRKDDFGNYDRKPSGVFDLKLDGAGSSGSHTFMDAGEYEYFCDRHPSMTAKVVVR